MIDDPIIQPVWDEIHKETLFDYPNETCGVIINQEYIRLTNSASNPMESFQLLPEEYVLYVDCDAIIHSHTMKFGKNYIYDIRTPSRADYLGQIHTDKPWYIVGTDGDTVFPPIKIPRERNNKYLGRNFMWYINDCYTLVQDYYYYEYGISLINHSTDFDFTKRKTNLFDEYLGLAGFTSRNYLGDIKDGEIVVISHKGRPASHLGIICGDRILHQDVVSISEPFHYYEGKISMILTHNSMVDK